MQQKFQLSKSGIAALVVLFILLVSVRIFQRVLFYDPLLAFFETTKKELPPYESGKLYLSLIFRYAVNSAISLGILWVVFKDRAVVKLSALLMLLFFVVLLGVFAVVLNTDNPSLLIIFYIRRFLIHPLFLILFLPAFYYQKYIRVI
jgi:exosortase F-associated protein